MKNSGNVWALVIGAFVFGLILSVMASESKYATGTTSAAVVFGDSPTGYDVTGLYVKSDKEAGVCDFYTKKSRSTVTVAPTNGATVVAINNATAGIAQNDVVVYAHANGTLHQTTAASVTTTNSTLASAITIAGNAADVVWGMQKSFVLPVGASAALNPNGAIFAVEGRSPLVIKADGTGSVHVAATANR